MVGLDGGGRVGAGEGRAAFTTVGVAASSATQGIAGAPPGAVVLIKSSSEGLAGVFVFTLFGVSCVEDEEEGVMESKDAKELDRAEVVTLF